MHSKLGHNSPLALAARFLIIFLLGVVGSLSAQTAITGTIQDASGANLPNTSAVPSGTWVRAVLKNFAGYTPTVNGVSILNKTTIDFYPNASGQISGTLYGNNLITPPGTYYTFISFYNGQATTSNDYCNIQGATWNLNTATTCTIAPPPFSAMLGAQTYTCAVAVGSTTWTCPHNFGNSNVIVECYDPFSHLIWPDTIVQTNNNVTTIGWVNPTTGTCTIMDAGAIAFTNLANAIISNPIAPQSIVGSNPLTLGGPLTVLGAITCTIVNAVACVSPNNPQGWAGSDIGAWINAAYAALPAIGGEIDVAGSSACYVATTPILLNTNGKPALLRGQGKSTCFDYSAVTSGSYITLDWGQGAIQGYQGGIQNVRILGACATTACSGVTAIGLNLGPTNGFVQNVVQNVLIGGFSSGKGAFIGIQNGANAFINTFIDDQVYSSKTGLNDIGSENLNWYGGAFAQNATAVVMNSSTDAFFYSTSFDDDTLAISNGGIINCDGCHFENPGLGVANYISSSTGHVRLSGGLIYDDVNTGTNAQLISISAGSLDVDGTVFLSAGRTTTNAVSLTGGTLTSATLKFSYSGSSQPGSVGLTNESTPGFTGYLTSLPNESPSAGMLARLFPNVTSQTASPAASGFERVANGDQICWRNNANSSDVCFAKNTGDQPTFGGNIVPTINGAVTAGHVAAFANSGQVNDGGLFTVEYCGATTTGTQPCAKTVQTVPFMVWGDVLLNSSATQSITTLPFTDALYSCSGSDLTSAAGIVSFNTYASASVTIQESGGSTSDHLRYQCLGH